MRAFLLLPCRRTCSCYSANAGLTRHSAALQVLHEHFRGSAARTEDLAEAQLFMVPVYLGRYYNWFWQQWSTPGNPWEIVEDCEPRHRAGSPECWWEKWMWAKGVSIAACLTSGDG